MTNGEDIRQMDDQQLADFLEEYVGCERCPIEVRCKLLKDMCCEEVFYSWLKEDSGKSVIG